MRDPLRSGTNMNDSAIKRAIALLWDANRFHMLLYMCIAIGAGALPIAEASASSHLYGRLVEALTLRSVALLAFRSVVPLLLVILFCVICTALLMQLRTYVQKVLRVDVMNTVQKKVLIKASAMDLEHFETPAFHARLQTSTNEAANRPIAALEDLSQLLISGTIVVAFGIFIISWHWWAGFILGLGLVLGERISRFGRKRNQEIAAGNKEVEMSNLYYRAMMTNDFVAKDIRLYGLQGFFMKKITDSGQQLRKGEGLLARRRLFLDSMTNLLGAFIAPSLLALAVLELCEGILDFQHLAFLAQAFYMVSNSVRILMTSLIALSDDSAFIRSYESFLSMEPFVERRRIGRGRRISMRPAITFENVSFQYPGFDTFTLKDLTFSIKPGEVVALVGENGVGKTTIVKLLGGLYQPTSGRITVDGVDINEIDRTELRERFGTMLQDFVIFHLSAYENIGIGDVNNLNDLKRIEMVGRELGLDKIFGALPGGYETVLGRFVDRGYYLSGGQRQLVALARAFMRDAGVLVMDEPTSALDINNEVAFFKKLFDMAKERKQSVIFITHRFGLNERADKVLMIEAGKVSEEGRHADLLERRGKYAAMYYKQAQLYSQST